jgi:hypothetical protein
MQAVADDFQRDAADMANEKRVMVPGEGSGPNVCPFALSGWLRHESTPRELHAKQLLNRVVQVPVANYASCDLTGGRSHVVSPGKNISTIRRSTIQPTFSSATIVKPHITTTGRFKKSATILSA